MNNHFFKLVCVDEANVFEYQILEDTNLANLDEVHRYLNEHISEHLHEGVKWLLIPFEKMCN
jgi:hypothetical protein